MPQGKFRGLFKLIYQVFNYAKVILCIKYLIEQSHCSLMRLSLTKLIQCILKKLGLQGLVLTDCAVNPIGLFYGRWGKHFIDMSMR